MNNQKNKFAIREEEIMKFWQDNKIFEKSLKQRENSPIFSFYDGPPFATGLPHYGHLVASLMKDAIPRYQTMKGNYVERRWGWDCHGLPIENLVEKELGLKDKHDIEKIGIEKFCDECQSRVFKYADEWKKIIPRFGRWVDMENAYKTMDPEYMESIWWVFKTLWDKKLIYQGYKSMHICPRCETTLSNFEVTQGYKDITDISVTAKFELADEPGTFVLAWTTTPWTLIGNVALAINDKIIYCKVKSQKSKVKIQPPLNPPLVRGGNGGVDDSNHREEYFIIAKERLESLGVDYVIVEEFSGKKLVGKKYNPLFDYYLDKNLDNKENLYTIQPANFVSTEEGTGIVHIAPAFGEDDMNLGKEKKLPFIQHVKMDGTFKEEVKDFAGWEVKPKGDPKATDKKIVEYLEEKNLMFLSEEYKHSYPHCWRCDSPLLNYATESWFVKVTKIKKKLVANNKKTAWVPEFLRDGRFGKWLEEARDWSISRNRYWGDPLPVWECQNHGSKCGNRVVVGSIEDLEKLSGKKIKDLHKPTVDKIEFKCAKCGGTMKRIPEVLDCWFESGSMPYAQFHYPFENKEKFEKSFPADFIAEGLDQTRGWFYTLMVLSTALFNKPAFKNVIVNGIVQDKSGKKLSKKLANYAGPAEMFDKYGADTLRYYLLTSPVMRADDLIFNEQDVVDAMRNVFMMLENILSFYKIYEASGAGIKSGKSKDILDQWIVARFRELTKEVSASLDSYELMKASRPIEKFINDLSTWYLRRSRDRFKTGDPAGIATFGRVLLELAKILAPFAPFTAEHLYKSVGGQKESVHLEDWPTFAKASAGKPAKAILEEMELARKIVELGLAKRAEAKIKVRQPLQKLIAYSLELKADYTDLIKDELNIKEVEFKKGETLSVELDTKLTKELELEGESREFIRQINSIRKEGKLTVQDRVNIFYAGDIDEMVENFSKEILKATLSDKIEKGEGDKEIKVNEKTVRVRIEKI